MIVVIDLNKATHMAINVPVEQSAQLLPSLATLIEKNALFYCAGWNTLDEVTPQTTIMLGSTFVHKNSETEILVKTNESIDLPESFQAAKPELFFSMQKVVEEKTKRIDSSSNKIRMLEDEIFELKQSKVIND